MLSKWKKKTVISRFEKDRLHAKKKKRNLNTKLVKSVGILMEESQFLKSNIVVNKIQQELKIPLDNIEILVFKPFEKKKEYSEFECTEKDFGWYGSLKLNKLQEFVKNEYDLFINYGFQENLYWKVITLHSLSNFKVGFASEEDSLYDLSVSDEGRDLGVLTTEMIKYLKILKKI